MLCADLCALVHDALARDDQQDRTDENIAMLLDRDNFELDSLYSQWITDPNDPEVKAAAADRKRRGIKPSKQPLIYPIALRRQELAEIHKQRYAEAVQRYSTPERDRKLTLAEVLRMRKR
ncbi:MULTISPECIES: hypothetical protein [unclassified Rhodococcus (in: high G+C Gram-positive bacteria)]|uniref:hypothetical protein n=1 Tax=unclassified Rhodococcus (in: high G+C Gram-positive bacteria) TaxID=192944 RepID=UPI00117B7095|nr:MULTISPECIES: hypothetical protein [unclassified Rhodococcus (in: high G+C Gram-positive bacteria)]